MSGKDRYFEEKKNILAYEADIHNRLKISSIFNQLQDVAAVHADLLGVGFNDLYKQDLAWVLSWAKLNVLEYPSFGETVTIRTWPRCRHKMFSMRDYTMSGNNGNILLNATSAWLPINVNTKKIIDIQQLPKEIEYQADLAAIDEFPEKIIAGKTKEILLHKKFRYSDIDINKHVNNSRYIELFSDIYSIDIYRTHLLKSISVLFSSESFLHDEIEISRSFFNGMEIIEGINSRTGKRVFAAKPEWTRRTGLN